MSRMRKVIPTQSGLSLLLIAEAFGIALLFFSSETAQWITQAIFFIVSMVIIWYASHPLSHYFFARSCGVGVLFFYLGRSEMSHGGITIAKKLSPLLLTIGTKLDQSKLKLVSPNRRAWIYGSGALTGVFVIALIESFAILYTRYSLVALVLGGLFFIFTLVSEFFLSTKSGDLAKMKSQYPKAR